MPLELGVASAVELWSVLAVLAVLLVVPDDVCVAVEDTTAAGAAEDERSLWLAELEPEADVEVELSGCAVDEEAESEAEDDTGALGLALLDGDCV